MNLGLINSAFAQAGKGTRYGLQQARKIGFDTIDVFADPMAELLGALEDNRPPTISGETTSRPWPWSTRRTGRPKRNERSVFERSPGFFAKIGRVIKRKDP